MIKTNLIMMLSTFFLLISCIDQKEEMRVMHTTNTITVDTLPNRKGARPATTTRIPHTQLNLNKVEEVHQEMIRRIFSVPGISNEPSVVLSWEGLWVDPNTRIINPQALISEREFGHVHDDGSLHIFLEPNRAIQAIDAGWAVLHPFAAEGRQGWEGFVMLYTPQTMEELDVVFELIVDAFNFVTGKKLRATDFY